MARNALDLSIIARLAADGEDLQEIEGEAAPWEAYIASIDRENTSALPPITDLAWAAAKARAMAIQIASAPPEAQLKTLLSRGVLVFDGRLRYRFRHERIRDYLVARDVARVGVSPRPLFDRLDGAGPSPRNPPQSGTLAEHHRGGKHLAERQFCFSSVQVVLCGNHESAAAPQRQPPRRRDQLRPPSPRAI